MNNSIKDFFWNWQTGLFCFGIGAISFVLRKMIEKAWKGSTTPGSWWEEVGLHALPILVGVGFALAAVGYPFPPGVEGGWVKVFYGLLCGTLSESVYTIGKRVLRQVGVLGPAQNEALKPPTPAEPAAPDA